VEHQDALSAAAGEVSAEVVTAIMQSDELRAGVLAMATELSSALKTDLPEITASTAIILREQGVLAIQEVLAQMLREDTITDAASAATSFSIRLSRTLRPELSAQAANALRNDLGPALGDTIRNELGPALNDVLSDELFPSLFAGLNHTLLTSTEKITQRASRGAVLGVIEAFNDQQILAQFDGYVSVLRRETLADLTESYEDVLQSSLGTVQQVLVDVETGVERTADRRVWLAALFFLLMVLGVAFLLWNGGRVVGELRKEQSEMRINEEDAHRHTQVAVAEAERKAAVAIEEAERKTAVATSNARQIEKALELVTEAIKAHENLNDIKMLVLNIRQLEEERLDDGGVELRTFLDARKHLKIAS
jgi:rRNA maturation endonuclease Nob1